MNMSLVKCATTVNRSLTCESPNRFEATLNGHETKFFTEVVGIDRLQAVTSARIEKKQTVTTNLGQRRRARLSIEQQRNQVIAGRPHTRVLMIDDPRSEERRVGKEGRSRW